MSMHLTWDALLEDDEPSRDIFKLQLGTWIIKKLPCRNRKPSDDPQLENEVYFWRCPSVALMSSEGPKFRIVVFS